MKPDRLRRAARSRRELGKCEVFHKVKRFPVRRSFRGQPVSDRCRSVGILPDAREKG